MLRRLFAAVAGWVDSEDDDGDEDEAEYIPSRLDASVLEAHGMGTAAAERELEQLEEQGRQLEEQDRRR